MLSTKARSTLIGALVISLSVLSASCTKEPTKTSNERSISNLIPKSMTEAEVIAWIKSESHKENRNDKVIELCLAFPISFPQGLYAGEISMILREAVEKKKAQSERLAAQAREEAKYGPFPSEYESKVKSHSQIILKDPLSAQYMFGSPYRGVRGASNEHPTEYGWIVPVRINSKNGFGGYSGYQSFHFFITAKGSVSDETANPSNIWAGNADVRTVPANEQEDRAYRDIREAVQGGTNMATIKLLCDRFISQFPNSAHNIEIAALKNSILHTSK